MVQIDRMSGCYWGASLLCAQWLGACATDVAIFSAWEDRSAAAGAAGATGASNSTNVLLMPTTVALPDASCRPGHYVGVFNGTYNSAAWMSGTMPLSIAATPSMDRPGLEFWLERVSNDCAVDEEFCADFTVRGGKIRGFANPFFNGDDGALLAVRFEIDFGGDLDCTRGMFKGLLQNGCYDLASVLFYFEGDAPATYDATTASFTNGMWTVKERPSGNALFPPGANIGGMGNWQASLADNGVDPVAESASFCDM